MFKGNSRFSCIEEVGQQSISENLEVGKMCPAAFGHEEWTNVFKDIKLLNWDRETKKSFIVKHIIDVIMKVGPTNMGKLWLVMQLFVRQQIC